ncbi:maleylpyruvate isomerase [Murinocardiopsis flavida]|uniref:Maleylpyruvate isomerase n=1 Tax=Murinocardiopsis flavida TaxID=645275 RepID=A0A2P8DR20_9ACTN|nr:maleylpyruvate isomerase family mycothiol-dependent enzyme [Murinocardiopsis flavida]PSK99659.1 maleylpyruvate isomerase [Murinocardiopsis flavida]
MSTEAGHHYSPETDLAALDRATARLLRTAESLTPDEVAEPSLLPGWSRGHVLSHLCRNADALLNGLTAARTGADVPMYASDDARDADIDAGAGRPAAEQCADLRASADRLAAAARALEPAAWEYRILHRRGFRFSAADVPAMRLSEVEYHHVDLDAGYGPGHWAPGFVAAQLTRLAERFTEDGRFGPVLLRDADTGAEYRIGAPAPEGLTASGPGPALLAWLSGRSNADGLVAHRGGERLPDARTALPDPPPLG